MSTLVSGALAEVTDNTFTAEVLRRAEPALVEFWAKWCGPCRMIAPVLAEIAGEREGSLTVRKLDADANPETMRAYQVMSLPTMVLFRDGKPLRVFVGTRTKARLLAELDEALAGE
ncbi:thioredoxin [Amycolatopsis sp. H20-H5]|uniref:thioredoxin n=1 Tax=Amycolatopsis sp. H20-H5 TaxID=3046309 RepID=UPI002DB9B9AF|nr:thioredoxin [Amycolatopsis sp. H20-H5]MEC3977608.1 thioredoxin [Amycolatopsis sp. H20-H5]